MPVVHLAGNVVLLRIAGAVVAHGRKLHRIRPIGKRQLLGEERKWKERGRDRDCDEQPPHGVYLSVFCFFIRHSIDVVSRPFSFRIIFVSFSTRWSSGTATS